MLLCGLVFSQFIHPFYQSYDCLVARGATLKIMSKDKTRIYTKRSYNKNYGGAKVTSLKNKFGEKIYQACMSHYLEPSTSFSYIKQLGDSTYYLKHLLSGNIKLLTGALHLPVLSGALNSLTGDLQLVCWALQIRTQVRLIYCFFPKLFYFSSKSLRAIVFFLAWSCIVPSICEGIFSLQGPLLLTWTNFNPSMKK